MNEGGSMFIHQLGQYLTFFVGRIAVPIDAFGPTVADGERAWELSRQGLGLSEAVGVDDPVNLTPEGLPPIDGVVDHLSPHFLGVRTPDALFRFIYAFDGSVMVGHHDFSADVDRKGRSRPGRPGLIGCSASRRPLPGARSGDDHL